MKKLIASAAGLAAVATTLFVPTVASAQAAASPLSFNIGVVSDYRYRGISQTRFKPALQGGADYAFSNGFYLGAWATTIKWIKDNNVDGPLELDLYGGYKGEVVKDLAFDVGFLRYEYVGNKLKDTGGGGVYKNANTNEIYGALTYGPVTGKISYALSDLFGNYNFNTGKSSSGSYYADLSGTFDVAGFAVVPHVGYQKVENIPLASYMDYSLTVSKEVMPGLTVSLAGVGTNANDTFYISPAVPSKLLGRKGLVLGVKYAF